MLHTSIERLPVLPLVFSANVTSDPETPGATGDPEIPGGGKIKPPTVSQPASSSEVGIKPPTVSDTPEDNPPDKSGNDPIIIAGGG